MFNILSYVGMNMQSEVCLWTLLGLVRTIFDATLFKVNANLKQVWQMTMPPELSMPVQRVLRTMISGIMLVQCFTVYVYLASYIVLLYPVFLEERPPLVLPWLLLAAIRKLLCELTSLTLGLGTCLLLGPARSPCVKFVMLKVLSIMPAFYMWMLIYSYYNTLKVASAFKTFTAGSARTDPDYGLELAVRRRRTKSLLDEDQLRNKLVASLYGERHSCIIEEKSIAGCARFEITSRMVHSTITNIEDMKDDAEILNPCSVTSNKLSESGSYEDWFGNKVVIPRDTDRILEQFVLMMLRIGIHLKKVGTKPLMCHMFSTRSITDIVQQDNLHDAIPMEDDSDTPPLVASSSKYPASYVREYPQIFMKKASEVKMSISKKAILRHSQCPVEKSCITDKNIKSQKHSVTINSNGTKSLTIEKEIHKRIIPATKSSSVDNVENIKSNEIKREVVDKNEIIEQTKGCHKYSRPVKQSSCSCFDVNSESSDSMNSIIQKMKMRLSENRKSFR
ncbi:hypothetical protein K1T71_007199 [Dendrolimus kikuchii]|uniref:Uncharacterized protein n=1 Tax=Dendrolimus kikuchii TaxID=765133 RepID=A0ACC1D038_9NEOP|nr:hypothetical protein K1T71_007199 [Dendrolimus kikuchii]